MSDVTVRLNATHTTIILSDRPTVIAFLALSSSALSENPDAVAGMRDFLHEEVEAEPVNDNGTLYGIN